MKPLKLRSWEFLKIRIDNEGDAVAVRKQMESDGWTTITATINPCVFKRYDGDTPYKPKYPVWLKPWEKREDTARETVGRSHKEELASTREQEAKRRRRK
jgi:hypothetical protein